MKTKILNTITCLILIACLTLTCSQNQPNVKSVIDELVTHLYTTMGDAELSALNDEAVLKLLSDEDKHTLATNYWSFNVNVPVVVSIMRHVKQQIVPFWLTIENGFKKTDMMVANEEYRYEVWQKSFAAGRVELGVNGFDMHRSVYFVSVGAQQSGDQLELSDFYPANQFVGTMESGAFTYHDWDELVLMQVPDALIGQKLLTTIRGRAREAHLIRAFRKTPFPSSPQPDQIMLTWSDDPQTTQTIQWRTSTDVPDGVVVYAEKASQQYQQVVAERIVLEDRLLRNDRYIHRFTAVLRDLKPGTKYVYRVGSHDTNNWSDDTEFITAPEKDKPFTFVYFGDTHRSPHWGKIVSAAFARHPHTAFYTIAGDVVSTGLYRDDWDQLFAYGSDVIKQRPLMPSLGNHDDQDGLRARMFCDLFALPENGPFDKQRESVYSFEYDNAIFLMLAPTYPVASQVEWIDQQLATTNATWKFAVFHFPPYMYESDYQDIRDLWGPVFDKYHLDLAMSGHVHYYCRSKPMYNQQPVASSSEGTIYVTSVAIPSGDEDLPDVNYADVHFGGGWLYQTIDIDGKKMTYWSLDIEGNVKDELVIKK